MKVRAPSPFEVRTVAVVVGDALRVSQGGPQAIAARQKERLRKLVAFARASSPFYRELYRGLPHGIDDVTALPVTTKAALMARFDDWVTDPEVTRAKVEAFAADASLVGEKLLGRYTVWTTSGSTGTPALLVQDERALSVMTGLGIARAAPAWVGQRELAMFLRRGARGAIVFATGGHFMALTMAERAFRGSPFLRGFGELISVLMPVQEMVARLNALDPTVLASYASGLSLLAEEKAAGRLKISPVLMISTGESLTPAARERVEAVFGEHVRETYGASEIQIAAFECRHGRLHVNADWVILEPVDENYRPVPPGTPSRTVLATSLSNRVQPVIRYDLGDRITVFPDACRCGSPLPAIRVEGRSDEILSFPSPGGGEVHLLPTALTTQVIEMPGLRRFQLVKKGADRLIVSFETEPGHDADRLWTAIEGVVARVLEANGVRGVRIERSASPPKALSRAGKLRQVWSEPA